MAWIINLERMKDFVVLRIDFDMITASPELSAVAQGAYYRPSLTLMLPFEPKMISKSEPARVLKSAAKEVERRLLFLSPIFQKVLYFDIVVEKWSLPYADIVRCSAARVCHRPGPVGGRFCKTDQVRPKKCFAFTQRSMINIPRQKMSLMILLEKCCDRRGKCPSLTKVH